jgi:ABC-type bacteriocin/lantibiotic exporter with double-glycine peptidase domain
MNRISRYLRDIIKAIGVTKVVLYSLILLGFYGFNSMQPFFISQAIESVNTKSKYDIIMYLFLILCSFLSTSVLGFINSRMLQIIRKESKAVLWKDVNEKDYFFFINRKVGDVQSLIGEISHASRFLQYEGLQLLVRVIVTTFVYSALIARYNIWLAPLYFIFIAGYFVLSVKLSRNDNKTISAALEASAAVNSQIFDIYKNIETVISCGTIKKEGKRFENILDTEKQTYLKVQKGIDISHLLQKAVMGFAVIAILSLFVVWNNESIINISMVLILVYTLFAFDGFGREFLTTLEYRDKLRVGLDKLEYGEKAVCSGKKLFRETNDPIVELINIGYSYGNRTLFSGISFTIRPGEKIALVGPNGSGKSTLLKIVAGIINNYSGSILYSDSIGRDLLGVQYYSQAVSLFDRSIYANIIYPHDDYPVDIVKRLIADLKLDTLIEKDDDLFSKTPGDFGNKFSGGERQKILLARAIINDAPLILFDEMDSSLDKQTRIIFSNLIYEHLVRNAVIVITHKDEERGIYNKIIEMTSYYANCAL